MEYNIIKLSFDKKLTMLAGRDYAHDIYYNQVFNSVRLNAKNIITFPSHIESVASSFINGFIEATDIRPEKFCKYFSIDANDRVRNAFYDALPRYIKG